MKKYSILLALSLFFVAQTKALDASLTYATFKSPDQSYIEIYLHVVGETIEFATTDSVNFQASVEVIFLFKDGEKIVKVDKYQLSSPVSDGPLDFVDLKRYALKNGNYTFEVSLNDLNRADNAKTYTSALSVDYDGEQLMQSDIQLLGSFKKDTTNNPLAKNGMYMENLPFNFYDKRHGKLIFYNEVYNSDKAIGSDFLVRYKVEKVINNKSTTVLLANKKRKPEPINAMLFQLDISKLESGNYELLVEVRNRTDELLSSKKVAFQRSNPYLNIDELPKAEIGIEEQFVSKLSAEELVYCLRAIQMNVKDADVEYVNILIRDRKVDGQRFFLFNYWANKDPIEPAKPFAKYMEVARAVDLTYRSGFGFGFETDRGYVYMKYGPPDNSIAVENEPSAPPYEMWVYYEFPFTSQRNVKFIFYNPSLATNDFKMLHSTARGEVENRQWEVDLYRDDRNSIEGTDIDSESVDAGYSRNARRNFEDL